MAVLTNAGGLGILCADACEAAGLELPTLSPSTCEALTVKLPREASLANPIDMLGSATAATYESVLPHVLGDPNVDAVIVLFVPPVVAAADDVAAAVVEAVESAGATDKPVLAAFVSAGGTPPPFLREPRRVAAFAYPESAARALGRAAERAAWLRRPAGVVPALDGIDEYAARDVIREALGDRPTPGSSRRVYGPCSAPTASRSSGSSLPRAPTRRSLRQPSSGIRSRSRRRFRARTSPTRSCSRSTSPTRSPSAQRSPASGRRSSSSR